MNRQNQALKLHKLQGVNHTVIHNPLTTLSNDLTCPTALRAIDVCGGMHVKRSLTRGIRISVKFIHFGCH
jgi:hypothetical protein